MRSSIALLPVVTACAARGPDCADDERAEGERCVPAACGEGRWGDRELDGAVLADATAPDGGDGTEAAPHTTLQAAIDAAGKGGRVVAIGTFVENLLLSGDHDGLRLEGRCPTFSVLDGSAGGAMTQALVANGGPTDRWELAQLGITGGRFGGAGVYVGELVVSDVEAWGNVGGGLGAVLEGGTVTADRVWVHGNTGHPAEGGLAVVARSGRVVLRASRVEGNAGSGVAAAFGGVAEVEDTVIAGTTPDDVEAGNGLHALYGGTVICTRCLVTGTAGSNVAALESGVVELYDSDVTDGRIHELEWGRGVDVWDGGGARLVRTRLVGNREAAVIAQGPGSWIELEDVEIRGTRPNGEGHFGDGIVASAGAAIIGRRVTVSDNTNIGVSVRDPGTATAFTDLVVEDTGPDSRAWGDGVHVGNGAYLQIDRGTIARNRFAGLVAGGEGVEVRLTDVSVTGTMRYVSFASAFGVVLGEGALVEATRLVIDDIEGPGIWVDGGEVRCADCEIGATAFAGVVQTGGSLTLERAEIGSSTPDPQLGGGVGVHVDGPAHLRVEEGSVGPQRLAGVWIERALSAELSDVAVGAASGLPQSTPLSAWTVHGNGLFARRAGVALSRVRFDANAGPDVLLDAATATLDGVTGAAGAPSVVWQGCDGVAPPDGPDLPTPPACTEPPLPVLPGLSFGVFYGDVLAEEE